MAASLFLLRELVRRDLRARYVGSALGFAWPVVQPLWTLALYTFVFSTVLRISVTGERTEHFAVFLFAGLLPWMAIQDGLTRATTAVTDHAELVRHRRFPAGLLVAAMVASALVHEAVAAGVFAVFLALTGQLGVGGLPVLLVALPLQIALTVGLGCLLAAGHVLLRDVSPLAGLVLGTWFFLTPIVYPLSLVPEGLRPLIEVNPLTGLVGLYREAFLGGGLAWVPGTGPLVLAAAGLGWGGTRFFARLTPTFVDEL